MTIFDDDELVAALWYSRVLARDTHGVRWVRPARRPNESLGLGLTNRRVAPAEPRPKTAARFVGMVGRSKKLTGQQVLEIVQSPMSLSWLARTYGVTRAAIAYYRRTSRQGGAMAIESVRKVCS